MFKKKKGGVWGETDRHEYSRSSCHPEVKNKVVSRDSMRSRKGTIHTCPRKGARGP